jgi:AbrB family looped-hinge helix DNA binding protein
MATRITIKGQVTIPKRVREALSLSPGDRVEFTANGGGEFVVRKAPQPPAPAVVPPRRERAMVARTEAQMRRRAEELLELLRRLD